MSHLERKLAPIAFFAYARPEHTLKALTSLATNNLAQQSELFIFVDGPKANASAELIARNQEVKKIVASSQWCGTVTITEAAQNKGLANSIIFGVTDLVNRYGKVIVLEDDLVLHPDFLKFMNAGLDEYEGKPEVMSVTGYQFPIKFKASVPSAFFFDDIASWSWGTWKRAWDKFDAHATGWEELATNAKLRKRFNFEHTNEYAGMLEQQMQGKIDSWAIRWYYSVFKAGGINLYPRQTLVKNIGFDGTGEHCNERGEEDVLPVGEYAFVLPKNPKLDIVARKQIIDYWNLQHNHDIVTRIRRKMRQWFGA